MLKNLDLRLPCVCQRRGKRTFVVVRGCLAGGSGLQHENQSGAENTHIGRRSCFISITVPELRT